MKPSLFLSRFGVYGSVFIYMVCSLCLFFYIPDAGVNVQVQTVWRLMMILTGVVGYAFSVMPVVNGVMAFRGQAPGWIVGTLPVSVISLSMAALVYLLRLFPVLMISLLSVAFLFLFVVIAFFLWQQYIFQQQAPEQWICKTPD